MTTHMGRLFSPAMLLMLFGMASTVPAPAASQPDERPLLAAPNQARMQVRLGTEGEVQIIVDDQHRLEHCQAYLASRVDGATAWEEERATYKITQQAGDQLVLRADFARVTAEVRLERVAANRYRVGGELRNHSAQAIELARFHYLDGQVPNRALNLLNQSGHLTLPTATSAPYKESQESRWSRMGVNWPRLAEPMHMRPNIAFSTDVGGLTTDLNSPGFFFGFTGPGTAFGEIGIRTQEPVTPFYLAVVLDAVLLKPSESRRLEEAVVSFGDPQDEMRNWILACRDALGPARVRPPLVGYCSWYQLGQGVKPADIRKAIDEFAAFPAPPGGRTIQIDDGFQVMPGDWSGRGEWKTALPKMAAEIEAKGFIPGLWVAPTAIHASHSIVREHPEWLQRDASGKPCMRFSNWKNFGPKNQDGGTYFLEPDHPQAREFIRTTLRNLRAQGWRYIKIDFAYTVCDNRVKYDRSQTTFQSLRSQWQLFREALGEDAEINACIGGMWRYTIGVVDVQRLGGDIGSKPERMRKNLAEMMLRTHINGVWYQADPDVYYMRKQKSELNFEQSHLLTATQGLLGAAFLTSDFSSQWDAPANAVVRRYWNERGPQVPVAMRIRLTSGGLPEVLVVAYDRQHYALGLYNWADRPHDVSIRLADLHIPDAAGFIARLDSAGQEPVTLRDGLLTITGQPSDSLRIVHLELCSPPVAGQEKPVPTTPGK